jgi:hypothetical protein
LTLSPWIFGFHDQKKSAWVPHVVIGLVVIAVILVSQTKPGMMMAHKATPAKTE